MPEDNQTMSSMVRPKKHLYKRFKISFLSITKNKTERKKKKKREALAQKDQCLVFR